MIPTLKDKKIGILCGGKSQERDVSLRSGDNAFKTLDSLGYQVQKIDPKTTSITSSSCDIAFLALHGPEYEDGTIQAYLDSIQMPYTGCGVTASIIGSNKYVTKQVCSAHEIPTPQFILQNTPLTSLPDSLKFPVITKPLKEGSSVDINIADTTEELFQQTSHLTQKYTEYLCEEFIKGAEITVGIIDNPNPMVLPILELRSKNRFYDYEAKYTKGLTSFILPAEIPHHEYKAAETLALKLYDHASCCGVSRIDFIVCPQRGPLVLEINTIPGLTELSDLPAQAQHAGISKDKLFEIILKSALKRVNTL